MSSDFPIRFQVGDILAAKYRRTWYEAKIIEVEVKIECKVKFDGDRMAYVTDITPIVPEIVPAGRLRRITIALAGRAFLSCQVLWAKDRSVYKVRFHDGVETFVRRNQLSRPNRDFRESGLFWTDDESDEEGLGHPLIEIREFLELRAEQGHN